MRTKIIVQSADTSMADQSLLKWNGHDCNNMMQLCILLLYASILFWNLFGSANFMAVEAVVRAGVSCQAVCPIAVNEARAG